MNLACAELRFDRYVDMRKKINHVLKTHGHQLFKDLLENEIFSKQFLSWSFQMEFCLKRRLLSEILR